MVTQWRTTIVLYRKGLKMFYNQQVSNTSARQLDADMRAARAAHFNGDDTFLAAIEATHLGNKVVEKFVAGLRKEYISQDAWYRWTHDG